MNRHVEAKHKEDGARKKAPANAKQEFLRACVFYVTKDKASTYSLQGDGLLHLLQTAVDLGAAHSSMDIHDLMPHRTTVTEHILKEAQRVRELLSPTVKDAMREGCGGTMDLWTNQYTNQHMMAFTVSFVNKTFELIVYTLLMMHFEGEESADNIKRSLFDAMWEKYQIPEADLKKTKMTTDGGENVVKAVEDFDERLYCIDHALNVCLRSALDLKYHILLGKCQETPAAAVMLDSCERVVRLVKGNQSKDTARLRKVLKVPKQHNSRLAMLISIRAHYNEISGS
jgi:hypothetical protein